MSSSPLQRLRGELLDLKLKNAADTIVIRVVAIALAAVVDAHDSTRGKVCRALSVKSTSLRGSKLNKRGGVPWPPKRLAKSERGWGLIREIAVRITYPPGRFLSNKMKE